VHAENQRNRDFHVGVGPTWVNSSEARVDYINVAIEGPRRLTHHGPEQSGPFSLPSEFTLAGAAL
jgi:hypothetical protein